MKKAKIHITNLLSYNKLNIRDLSFNRAITDKHIREKYHAASFSCYKFSNSILDIEFDSKSAKCNSNRFKINAKDYLLLVYISKNSETFMKRDKFNYIFSSFYKTPLFRAKIIKATNHLNKYVLDIGFEDGAVRIFFLKELFIFADEVSVFYFSNLLELRC